MGVHIFFNMKTNTTTSYEFQLGFNDNLDEYLHKVTMNYVDFHLIEIKCLKNFDYIKEYQIIFSHEADVPSLTKD